MSSNKAKLKNTKNNSQHADNTSSVAKKEGEKGGGAAPAAASEEAAEDNDYVEEDRGLLSLRRQRMRQQQEHHAATPHHHHRRQYRDDVNAEIRSRRPGEWLRPYWLGTGLFLALFPFWVLDTLKDPIFGALTGGNLAKYQPTAKLFSVCMTLGLVCFLEYVSNERQRQRQHRQRQWQRQQNEAKTMSDADDILDGGGRWTKMKLGTLAGGGDFDATSTRIAYDEFDPYEEEDRVSSAIFISIGVPYFVGFGVMAYLLQFNPSVALVTRTSSSVAPRSEDSTATWHVLGYFLYAGIESFGSIIVATFWSFVNSTLSLNDAERYYGLIIAIAQLGAIAGSTIVTTHVWNNITLIVLVCLVILLHILVMITYDRRFQPTSDMVGMSQEEEEAAVETLEVGDPHQQSSPQQLQQPSSLWSGVHLILRHNYVLLILGASCLYEVSLTCLNYQMTLLGWRRFEQETDHQGITFTQFMGHYGQMVNISSLVLSSVVFPFLIRRLGLRHTLRLFPSLLMLANILAFLALPGNLWVLFVSMSVLKAMTYSIHDPSKEILYLPTSNSIKFKSKFWIDVVGARIAKAIGSAINNVAGSVDRSIRVASAPSLLTAAGLWFVCYLAGMRFDRLIETGTVVGVDDDETANEVVRQYAATTPDVASGDRDEGRTDTADSAEDEALFQDPTAPMLELSQRSDAEKSKS